MFHKKHTWHSASGPQNIIIGLMPKQHKFFFCKFDFILPRGIRFPFLYSYTLHNQINNLKYWTRHTHLIFHPSFLNHLLKRNCLTIIHTLIISEKQNNVFSFLLSCFAKIHLKNQFNWFSPYKYT